MSFNKEEEEKESFNEFLDLDKQYREEMEKQSPSKSALLEITKKMVWALDDSKFSKILGVFR